MMGIKISTHQWCRAIALILKGIKNVAIYVDDILLVADNKEEYLTLLEQVLQRLYDHNIVVGHTKCTHGYEEFDILGHRVNVKDHTVGIAPDKIQKVLDLKAPRTLRQLQAVIGTCAYVGRRTLPRFDSLLLPITSLLRGAQSAGDKGTANLTHRQRGKLRVAWCPEQDEALQHLREELISMTLPLTLPMSSDE